MYGIVGGSQLQPEVGGESRAVIAQKQSRNSVRRMRRKCSAAETSPFGEQPASTLFNPRTSRKASVQSVLASRENGADSRMEGKDG